MNKLMRHKTLNIILIILIVMMVNSQLSNKQKKGSDKINYILNKNANFSFEKCSLENFKDLKKKINKKMK